MIRALVCTCTLAAALYAQPTAQFEVATIKMSAAGTNTSSGIGTGRGRLNAHNVTLKRCIMGAYGIGPHQIAGGPDWIDTERFEINAKTERPTDDDDLFMLMLRGLLADRFKLTFHRETRTMPAFVIEIAKNGPKLQKVEPGEAVTNTNTNNISASIDARYTSMKRFAETLSREVDLPVVDSTGLDGVFTFKLHWTPERAAIADSISLFTAIQEQLGLRLRSQKAPVEVLVIDRADRPTEN